MRGWLLVAVAGCYGGPAPEGVACAPDDGCPSGQDCMSGVCLVRCPAGWDRVAGGCFQVFETASAWTVGRTACQSLGGDLAVIADDAALTDLHAYDGGTLWLGVDSFTGPWLTVHGTQPFEHWAPGEPDGGGNQPCMALNGVDGLEHDSTCSDTNESLCEL